MKTKKTTTPKQKGRVQSAEPEKAGDEKEIKYSKRMLAFMSNIGTGEILDMRAVLK